MVTTNDIPGYRIKAVLGGAMGIATRGIGSINPLDGRIRNRAELTEFSQLSFQAHSEATERMMQDAEQRGANAVVGMRLDSYAFYSVLVEAAAYGTAVLVEPIPAGEPGSTEQSAYLASSGQ